MGITRNFNDNCGNGYDVSAKMDRDHGTPAMTPPTLSATDIQPGTADAPQEHLKRRGDRKRRLIAGSGGTRKERKQGKSCGSGASEEEGNCCFTT